MTIAQLRAHLEDGYVKNPSHALMIHGLAETISADPNANTYTKLCAALAMELARELVEQETAKL